MTALDRFIERLQNTTLPANTANPYKCNVPCLDIGSDAPMIRSRQLREYLEARLEKARYVLIAEAKGFQGGRFTGVPLTSERILLGWQDEFDPKLILPSKDAQQTSNPSLWPKGFREPTATVVWKALQELGVNTFEVVMWNIYPFHPYEPDEGPLSNRPPEPNEINIGGAIFEEFIQLFPNVEVIAAIGEKAQKKLNQMDFPYTPLRHPSRGGVRKFREGLKAFIQQNP